MKNNVQVFISYCGKDEEKKNALKAKLQILKREYESQGVTLEICEMSTHCAGEWDTWMIPAVKASDVVIMLITDSIFVKEDEDPKRMMDELCCARNENKGIVPLVLTDKKLPDEYLAHIGRLSQTWVVDGEDGEEKGYEEAVQKAKILLDGIIDGKKVNQGDSVRILSNFAVKNEKFVGRKKEMDWLKDRLSKTNVVILKGEGGIGKTSLAENFFYQNPEIFDCAYIINASGGVRNAICDIDFESTRKIKNEEEKYYKNRELLSALSEKVIIIFDNCDTEIELTELYNIQGSTKCRFLITSRIGNEDFLENTLFIAKMEEDDLFDLVYKQYPEIIEENGGNREEVERKLKDFFNYVDGHTLTVEMAAAIMRDAGVSLQKISGAIYNCNEECKISHRRDGKATPFDHLKTLYDFANLSEIEEEILSAVCLIAPSVGIERKELKELLKLNSFSEINLLIKKTFLRCYKNRISMHPLFANVFYKVKNISENREIRSKVVDYLTNKEIEKYSEEEHYQMALLLEFLAEERKDLFIKDKKEQIENVPTKTKEEDSFLSAFSDVVSSYKKVEETLELEEKKLLTRIYRRCAEHFSVANRYDKEVVYYLKELELLKKIYIDNPNHPDLAASYNNAGLAYGRIGDYEKQLEYFLKALEIRETIYADNPNHPDLATSYNNVGYAYGELGEYEKQLEYLLKALEIYKTIYASNPNHPDLALGYNNVGYAYGDLGDYEKDLEYSLKALEIYKTIYADNPNHPYLATSYNNVGMAYGNLGENEKQLEYLLKALEIRKKIYASNPNHPDLAMSYNNVGFVYGRLGDYEKHLEYSLKALEIRKKIYADNPNHPDLAMSYNNVGSAYGDLGEYEKQLEYLLKALEIRKKIYASNPNHPDLATSYNNVGYAYGNLGDREKDLEYQLKALEIRKKIYADNPNHPDLATSYNNVGYAYGKLGDYEKDLEYSLKALEIRKKIYADNPNHPDLASSYYNIGIFYANKWNTRKAIVYLQNALEKYQNCYSDNPSHPDIEKCKKALEEEKKLLKKEVRSSLFFGLIGLLSIILGFFGFFQNYKNFRSWETVPATVLNEEVSIKDENGETINYVKLQYELDGKEEKLWVQDKYLTDGESVINLYYSKTYGEIYFEESKEELVRFEKIGMIIWSIVIVVGMMVVTHYSFDMAKMLKKEKDPV